MAVHPLFANRAVSALGFAGQATLGAGNSLCILGFNQVSTSSVAEGKELPTRSSSENSKVATSLDSSSHRVIAVHYVLEESSGYMEPTLRILAILHTVISFFCIIGYYCLKVRQRGAGPGVCTCVCACVLETGLLQKPVLRWRLCAQSSFGNVPCVLICGQGQEAGWCWEGHGATVQMWPGEAMGVHL